MYTTRRSSLTFLRHFPSSRNLVTIGIRREDPGRLWERRCPLTPDAVADLVQRDGVRVLIQDCERRVFPMIDFIKAGASPHTTLSPAHIVLGIKEPPLSALLTSPVSASDVSPTTLIPRTHLLFSHTHKGQSYNMPLLARFLAQPTRGECVDVLLPHLVDVELLTDREGGKRTVGFGWFAGVAGVLESLSAVAHHHLAFGVASPFLHTPRPYTHPSLSSLRAALHEIGAQIAQEGTPPGLGPFIIGVTGTGNVARGCLSMLSELPIQLVQPAELLELVRNPGSDLRKIYVVHAKPEHYLVHVSEPGRAWDRQAFYDKPEDWKSEFGDRIHSYLTLLLNGAGWAPGFPRLMTTAQLVHALNKAATECPGRVRGRGEVIGDISCDVKGGLEFLPRTSTLSAPFFYHRVNSDAMVQIMAVDILPTSIPRDSSIAFSDAVLPYVRQLINGYRPIADNAKRKLGSYVQAGMEKGDAQKEREEALERATVARDGMLAPRFAWLKDHVDAWRAQESLKEKTPENMNGTDGVASGNVDVSEAQTGINPTGALGFAKKKRVLMLGSGMVAGPAVQEIVKRGDVELVIASNSLKDTQILARQHENVKLHEVDVRSGKEIEALLCEADLVVSLLPVPFHPIIAEMCIKHRKHLVTASYISPAMHALHERAIAADVLLLNEVGLDPGLDHCSAHALIASLRAQKKRVTAFTSFCGGLPAPDCAENTPLLYKFSWNPRGALAAVNNTARFRLAGKERGIAGEDLLKVYFPDVPISNVLKLEGLANRDSIPYAGSYDLGPAAELRTLLRGTLRYHGFADLMHAFKAIGLLSDSRQIKIDRWQSLVRASLESRLGIHVPDDPASLHSALSDVIPSNSLDRTLSALTWLSQQSLPLVPPSPTATPISLFAVLLQHKLHYAPNERDLVVLAHEVITQSEAPQQQRIEVHSSSLVVYGMPTASAMARCVGLPVAFAALLVLDGCVRMRGVTGPTERSLYCGVLERMEEAGLGMREAVSFGRGMEDILVQGLDRTGRLER